MVVCACEDIGKTYIIEKGGPFPFCHSSMAAHPCPTSLPLRKRGTNSNTITSNTLSVHSVSGVQLSSSPPAPQIAACGCAPLSLPIPIVLFKWQTRVLHLNKKHKGHKSEGGAKENW